MLSGSCYARQKWARSLEYIPALETRGPKKGLALICKHKSQHILIAHTLLHTDFGDQYSATINVRDLPSLLRICLICMMSRREQVRKRNSEFIGFTHLQRKWRSICLTASRRKPAPPVVWPVVRQRFMTSEMG
jgi:hypothetical protein